MNLKGTTSWGAIRPEDVPDARLRLDFGLRPAIMAFNEWAVPGLGGAFFVRQLSWSCMGIALAGQLGRPAAAAAMAEGIEALASWIALRRENTYGKDPRIQGKRKFKDLDQLSFDDVSKRGAYVTVPFRRPAAASLAGLGFCERAETRFSSLRLARPGRELVEAVWEASGAHDKLLDWFSRPHVAPKQIERSLRTALLPDRHCQAERALVRYQLRNAAGARQRDNVLRLLESRDGPLADGFDGNAREQFLLGIESQEHRERLEGSFALEALRLNALRCAQSLVDSFASDERIQVTILAGQDTISQAFDNLARTCAVMEEKLQRLSQAPAEIRLFCQEQRPTVALADRVRKLAGRTPILFAIASDTMMCQSRGRGRLVDDAEPGEAEWGSQTGDIPRPLLRLERLLNDLQSGTKEVHGAT